MGNTMQKAINNLNDCCDICFIKARIGVSPLKPDIYDMMAMMQSLRELDLLRNQEVDLEM